MVSVNASRPFSAEEQAWQRLSGELDAQDRKRSAGPRTRMVVVRAQTERPSGAHTSEGPLKFLDALIGDRRYQCPLSPTPLA